MQKTLVIGDTHLKQELILRRADAAIEQLGVERVVILGDVCDEWRSNGFTFSDAMDALTIWVKERRRQGLAVDVLLGNHDMAYLMDEVGPGTHPNLFSRVKGVFRQIEALAATTIGDALATHAGVVSAWAGRYLDLPAQPSAAEVADALNALYRQGTPEALAALYTAGPGRGGWEIPGPLWADQSELFKDPLRGIDQIVGHTPVDSIDLWAIPAEDGVRTNCRLIFCDTLSLTSSMQAYGDGSMLLVEGRAVRALTAEELGLPAWSDAVQEWMEAAVLPFLWQ